MACIVITPIATICDRGKNLLFPIYNAFSGSSNSITGEMLSVSVIIIYLVALTEIFTLSLVTSFTWYVPAFLYKCDVLEL